MMRGSGNQTREVDTSTLSRKWRKKARKAPKPPLSRTHPEIAAQWHPRKNKDLGPDDVTYGSNVKVWWLCEMHPSHVWETPVHARCTKNGEQRSGCPFCSGRKVCVTNSLGSLFPKIAAELNPTKNDKIDAMEILAGSHQTVWWQCRHGHEWQAIVKSRTQRGSGCLECKGRLMDLRKYPEALRQFDRKKNRWLDPIGLIPKKKVWWRCTKNKEHTWFAAFDTLKGARCPLCTGKEPHLGDRLIDDPKLRRDFHPTKNGLLKAKDLALWSHKRIWWKCARGPDHEWQTSVKDRASYKTGCPFCGNKRLSVTNSLANIAPHIAQEWDHKKNKPKSPENIVATSMTKYWFLCKKGHSYQQNPFQRVNFNRGCYACYLSRGSKTKKANLLKV